MFRLAVFTLLLTWTGAFTTPNTNARASVALSAMNRRDAAAVAFAGLFGAVLPSNAAQNPALQTFKGGKKTKGSFIPGKGIRSHSEFDELVAAANPALQTFKGRKGTKGSFIPGKGIRSHGDLDELVAAENPALQPLLG